MERSLLGVERKDKLSNIEVRRRTQVKYCRYTSKKLKFDYTDHIAREGGGRWGRRVMDWYSRAGRRHLGRPIRHWHDELKSIAGRLWIRGVRDRDRWKRVGEA